MKYSIDTESFNNRNKAKTINFNLKDLKPYAVKVKEDNKTYVRYIFFVPLIDNPDKVNLVRDSIYLGEGKSTSNTVKFVLDHISNGVVSTFLLHTDVKNYTLPIEKVGKDLRRFIIPYSLIQKLAKYLHYQKHGL